MDDGKPEYRDDLVFEHPDGEVRWTSFVQNFNLQRLNGSPASYRRKSIYFLPDCNDHQPKGRTGGENFGIMAKDTRARQIEDGYG